MNPDAAKLNSLMQDPQMQRALMQMSTSNVPIAPLTSNGQTTHVPIANFLHALIRQAQAALQQLDALIPPQVQEALAENFGEDFAGEDLGEALLEEVRVNGGWIPKLQLSFAEEKHSNHASVNKSLYIRIEDLGAVGAKDSEEDKEKRKAFTVKSSGWDVIKASSIENVSQVIFDKGNINHTDKSKIMKIF